MKSPGDLLVKLGGAGDILYDLDELVVDPRLFLDYHVIPGKYLIKRLHGCEREHHQVVPDALRPDADYPALDALKEVPCRREATAWSSFPISWARRHP